MKYHLSTFWKFALAMATIVTFFILCFLAALSAAAGEYTVQEGETLSVISRKTGVSISEIRRANGLSGETIYMGQTLAIPDGDDPAVAPQPPAGVAPVAGTRPQVRTAHVRRALPVNLPSNGPVSSPIYTVKDGDTLMNIARRFNTTTQRLRELNGLSGETIFIGQKIRVREELPVATSPGMEPGANRRETVPASAPSAGAGQSYIVESGDTLSAISRKTGVSVKRLRELNGLQSDTIFVGQKIALGENTSATKPPRAEDSPLEIPQPAVAATHVVTDGETLFSISRRHSVSVPDLRAANGLEDDRIWVGQKLQIPGKNPGAPAQPGSGAVAAAPGEPVGVTTTDDGMITPTSPVPRVPIDPVWEKPSHYLDLAGSPRGVGDPQNHAAMNPARNRDASPAQPQPETAGESYVVQPGDTLWRISREHNVDLDRLRNANRLQDDVIVPGRSLIIPSS